MNSKRILVAPLNWGLGHAARCIPIIKGLEENGFEPILASDGAALLLLQKEFPHLLSIELPSYDIRYSTNGAYLKWKLLMESPRLLRTVNKEKGLTEKIVHNYAIKGIISDNRFGVRSEKLKKNVYITHQLNVLSGNTTFLSSTFHQSYIKKFEQCWIPDNESEPNLSCILGHTPTRLNNLKYIGPISRFEKLEIPKIYDYLVLLSGPEPQRSILENILLKNFQNTEKKILFVRGVMNKDRIEVKNSNLIIKDHLYGKALEEAMNCSETMISRSGYSSIMDLAKLQKKAFFIPTPGQEEQEYLAQRFEDLGMAPFCRQKDFEISQLKKMKDYRGLGNFGQGSCFRDLFTFFHGK
ncbi:glycosyltransferase [Christiangramia fulva]|uniref:Glycosyltransferase n=1 Tax=Christiangramia fulva TaxID=2126553 RepID=A0A2R3Z4V1_9FLAO|nr:glycosyltransferase [Christiangramia fulva]AVR45242.1 glycosyltransferase [Christiangramia fulva]